MKRGLALRLVELILLGLATWRIASLVQYERGPWAVFSRIRGWFGIQHNEDGEPLGWPDSETGRLLRCLDCGSVWVGLGMAGLYLAWPLAACIVALPFALSAFAIALRRVIDA
jgi:hypothetical protein